MVTEQAAIPHLEYWLFAYLAARLETPEVYGRSFDGKV